MAILEVKNIVKRYPGTLALDQVSVRFESGKIHTLVGKNGSGKSTLVNIIAGTTKETSGELFMDGKPLQISSPQDAQKKGIATVFQENSLVSGLTVAENIYIGRLPQNKFGRIDWKTCYRNAQELLDMLGIKVDAGTVAGELNIWQQQMVEIAKAMSLQPKVLQLDEPTASLAQNEVSMLFDIIRKLKEQDVIVIYISHKLHELWELADTCTVLRDGKKIGTRSMQELSREELISMMFGNVKVEHRPSDIRVSDEEVLLVKNLSDGYKFHNVSFSLHKGEILGIAGMLGAGRSELLSCIFGARKETEGEVILEGKPVGDRNPKKMNSLGLAMTQEDRKNFGLNLQGTIERNLCYASIYRLKKGISVDRKKEKEYVDRQIRDLDIKIGAPSDLMTSLSGGNQQKVVLGNWLNTSPHIIMLDEPTKGIDVNAKQQVFQIVWEQSRKGVSTILVSTELEELLEVCHRILIMYNGRLIGETRPEDVSVEELYQMCMGGQE